MEILRRENAIPHVDPGHPMSIGRDLKIGHAAVVQRCTIGYGSLAGIHATILNHAKIGGEAKARYSVALLVSTNPLTIKYRSMVAAFKDLLVV